MPVFPERVETDRLVLERLCRGNVALAEYARHVGPDNPHGDEQYRYLPRDPCETLGEAAERLDRFEREWAERERAEYAVRPRSGPDAGELAGTGGLVLDWERRVAKPAVNLRRPFWGRSYSGERARALVRVAFDRLDVAVVEVPVQVGNERSRRAVEAYVDDLGGEYLGRFRNDGVRPESPVDRHRFAIAREDYREATD